MVCSLGRLDRLLVESVKQADILYCRATGRLSLEIFIGLVSVEAG